MQIAIEVAAPVFIPELLGIGHSMRKSPLSGNLSLCKDVSVVVRAEAGETTVGRHTLKVAMQPGILAIIRIKLSAIAGRNLRRKVNAGIAHLCLSAK